MIFSLHPQVVDKDGKVCLYTQDTYRIGKTEGECLADVPWKFYNGEETRNCEGAEVEDGLLSMEWFCVVGCGAVGSLFAAHLAKAGEVEVWAYDLWKEHTDAIRKNGLRLSGAAEFTAQTECDQRSKELPRCDYGIVATKAIHTRNAIAQAAHIFDEQCRVLGAERCRQRRDHRRAREVCSPRHDLSAGHTIAPGHIGYDIKGDTWVGPFEPTHTSMSKVEELAGLMTRSGMNTIALKDARGAQWTKLIFNASTNPVGALTLLHHGAATRFAATGQLFNDLIAEGEAVAESTGHCAPWRPAPTSTERRRRSRQAPCQHAAGRPGEAANRSGLHERRYCEVGEKSRRSDATKQSHVGADQRPGAFVERPRLRPEN